MTRERVEPYEPHEVLAVEECFHQAKWATQNAIKERRGFKIAASLLMVA